MDLLQLASTLRRRWKFVIVVFLVGVLSAGAFAYLKAPTYQSQTRIYVASTSSGTLDAYNVGLYSAQRVASYANLATEPSLMQAVLDRVGQTGSPDELADRIDAEAVPNTVILQVTVRADTPQEAYDLARAHAAEVVDLVAELEEPIEGDDADPPVVARLSGDASLETSPVAPNIPLVMAVGALLGLLLGMAGAVLRELFDASVKSSDELAELTSATVMAVVPYDSSVPKHPLISDAESERERAEAFRVLRTSLQFADLDTKRRLITVTSAVPDEGKSVTATNLAIALAQTGRRVLLLDCDFRKPQVANLMGLENSVGLLTVLVGRIGLAECIQSHESGVDVIATGPTPPNPAEVLETQAMKDFLDEVREAYDVVIIDVPPLLPVADSAILAPRVDGVLVVTRHGIHRDLVRRAFERLSSVDASVIGTVLNKAPRRSAFGFGYAGDYGYGYGYGYGPELPTVDGLPSTPRGGRRAQTPSRRRSRV